MHNELSEAIVEGKLPPGERLRETQMAEAMGVSRTPVREAFVRLKQQRLLSSDVIWSRTGHDLLEQALENIKPQAHFYMYLTRQAGQTDYAEKHRILIEFLKKGDRSMVNEIMLDHVLSSSERAIAWWERRQEKMAVEQDLLG